MNRNEFEANWHQLKAKIPEKWSKVTPDEISKMSGKYEQFLGTLQQKYAYSREQAEKEITNWPASDVSKDAKVERLNPGAPNREERPGQQNKGERQDKKRKAG